MRRELLATLLAAVLVSGCSSTPIPQVRQDGDAKESETTEATEAEPGASTEAPAPTVVDNRDKKDATPEAPASDVDFDVKGHLFENSIGDTLYFCIVTNTSSETVRVNGNAVALDASGATLGADEGEIDVLAPGETSIMQLYFDGVTGVHDVELSLSHERTSYHPVIANLDVSQSINDRNLTVQVTNTGTESAQFVEAYALFFDGAGNVCDYDSTYVTDGDSEIKPQASVSAQLDTYNDFDHVECYLTGRSDGSTAKVQDSVGDDDFDTQGYVYESDYGGTRSFLVVTSKAKVPVGIDINATAYDAGGNVVGAASSSIDAIGPGEQSIASFYYGEAAGIARVDYALQYDDTPSFESVLGDLQVQQSVNDRNVVVTVANTGTKPAEFVEAYALFFDGAGNVCDYDSTYVTDGDSEIKPGATLSAQLDTYEDYATVACYLTGRR